MRVVILAILGVTAAAISVPEPGSAKACSTDESYPQHYVSYKTEVAPVIDGNLNEKVWDEVEWTDDFVDIATTVVPRKATRTKIRWDDEFLYVAAFLEEDEVWATIKEHDEVIFHDNDFEVFVDPAGSTHNYKELEVNAFGTTWDLLLDKPYDNGGAENSGRTLGQDGFELQAKAATQVDGTINDATKHDTKSWTVEIAIPIEKLLEQQREHGAEAPRHGKYWRINFSRVQWRVNRENGVFVKDPKFENEDNWVWSQQGEIAMHMPERWGVLQFSNEAPGKTAKVVDPTWRMRHTAAAIYHAQKSYYDRHKQYTTDLKDLKGHIERKSLDSKCTGSPSVTLTGNAFKVSVPSVDGSSQVDIYDDRLMLVNKARVAESAAALLEMQQEAKKADPRFDEAFTTLKNLNDKYEAWDSLQSDGEKYLEDLLKDPSTLEKAVEKERQHELAVSAKEETSKTQGKRNNFVSLPLTKRESNFIGSGNNLQEKFFNALHAFPLLFNTIMSKKEASPQSSLLETGDSKPMSLKVKTEAEADLSTSVRHTIATTNEVKQLTAAQNQLLQKIPLLQKEFARLDEAKGEGAQGDPAIQFLEDSPAGVKMMDAAKNIASLLGMDVDGLLGKPKKNVVEETEPDTQSTTPEPGPPAMPEVAPDGTYVPTNIRRGYKDWVDVMSLDLPEWLRGLMPKLDKDGQLPLKNMTLGPATIRVPDVSIKIPTVPPEPYVKKDPVAAMVGPSDMEVRPWIPGSVPGMGNRWEPSLQSYSDAYILCYPLVLMNQTKNRWPKVNTMVHKLDYKFFSTDIVAPNLDAIQSSVYMDLSDGPVVFHVPKLLKDMYYVAQWLDMNTNTIASIGTRTTGMQVSKFIFEYQEFYDPLNNATFIGSDTVQGAFYQVNSPTKWVWAIIRMFPRNQRDMDYMASVQRNFSTTPWSVYKAHGYNVPNNSIGEPEKDHSDMDPPPKEVSKMDAKTFFTRCADTMAKGNEPTPLDPTVNALLFATGLTIMGNQTNFRAPMKFDIVGNALMNLGVKIGEARISVGMFVRRKQRINGWLYSDHENGNFGRSYMYRAGMAMYGLGANQEEDAVYCNHDMLKTRTMHVVTFPKDPPVYGYWSLSLYTPDIYFYHNAFEQYTVSTREHNYEKDGSIRITVGLLEDYYANGGNTAKNFLVAPPDVDWKLVVRLYYPKRSVIERTFKMPKVVDTGIGGLNTSATGKPMKPLISHPSTDQPRRTTTTTTTTTPYEDMLAKHNRQRAEILKHRADNAWKPQATRDYANEVGGCDEKKGGCKGPGGEKRRKSLLEQGSEEMAEDLSKAARMAEVQSRGVHKENEGRPLHEIAHGRTDKEVGHRLIQTGRDSLQDSISDFEKQVQGAEEKLHMAKEAVKRSQHLEDSEVKEVRSQLSTAEASFSQDWSKSSSAIEEGAKKSSKGDFEIIEGGLQSPNALVAAVEQADQEATQAKAQLKAVQETAAIQTEQAVAKAVAEAEARAKVETEKEVKEAVAKALASGGMGDVQSS